MAWEPIDLSDDERRILEEYAARRGITPAEALRLGIARLLDEEAPPSVDAWQAARAVLGRYQEPEHDVSERHDEYLAGGER